MAFPSIFMVAATSLFRVPPFPGSLVVPLARQSQGSAIMSKSEAVDVVQIVRTAAVGGTYWGLQPPLPPSYKLLSVRDPNAAAAAVAAFCQDEPVVHYSSGSRQGNKPTSGKAPSLSGACDPWHLVRGASEVVADADSELAMIAALGGIPIRAVGEGVFSGADGALTDDNTLAELFVDICVRPFSYRDPFSGEPISIFQAIDLCAFWRRLIDANRDIAGAMGFAGWKRRTIAPMLWNGSTDVRFLRGAEAPAESDSIAVWKSRVAPAKLRRLEQRKVGLIEVEDGFIRSAGLGADCVPPLSIIVDRLGIYFDPAGPSDLEELLEHGQFDASVLDRAIRLRELIVSLGISKYETAGGTLERRRSSHRQILVPGQVEDDRSILSGGGAVRTNLELLRRAREAEPDAYIIYKPHPDVEAGHRKGAIADNQCLLLADEIARHSAISPLIGVVDELHVNTSLAGFEALLQGKGVTTHGVPFYAGWGLTRDLGPVPSRRTRQRTVDELIAAALLIYPRYLDPDTGLPCPPEVLIRRLSQPVSSRPAGFLVRMRRLEGRLRRQLSRMWKR